MKTLGFLVALGLALLSCGKSQEETGGLKTYRNSKHHFSFKYVSNKMEAKNYEPDRNDDWKLWVSLGADLSDEFPQDIEQGVYMGLYSVIVYKEKEFKGFSRHIEEIKYDEGDLNGIPAFVTKDIKERPRSYILIIPGRYLKVWLEGVDINADAPSIPQAESNRFEQLTYEMIKHFKWEQKIDTNGEEFKSWKKHIWEILNGVRP